MYLTRREVMLAAGGLPGFEAATERYFALLQQQEGPVRATLLNSLGFPERYTTLEQWESRAQAQSFARSAAIAAFVRKSPLEGIANPSRPLEAYEVVHRIVGHGAPGAAYLIDEIVGPGPGKLQEFEESRGEVYRLRKEFGPGFAVSLLSRFLGGANRYLIFGGFVNPGDDQRTGNAPEIRRYWEEHPTAESLVISAIRDHQVLVRSLGPDPI
jgi:quinol monooxygenase YgiN